MRFNEQGMTLIELVMVIIIIGIIAGVAMKSMDAAIETGRVEATKKEMLALVHAIAGNPDLISNGVRSDFGYVGDVGALPPNLEALVTNPGYATWNGPYLRNDFIQNGDDYKTDAWGTQYTYVGDVVLSSSGSGSTISRQIANRAADLTSNGIQGTIQDAGGLPPGSQNGNVAITLTYPDGAGSMTTTPVATPNASGNFSFAGIPVGHHTLRAINTPTSDTVISYVSVNPGSNAICNLHFGVSLWSGSSPSGSDDLELVAGTPTTMGGGDEIQFEIRNNSGESKTINWIEVSYTRSPTTYFEEVVWNGFIVAFKFNDRYTSDDHVTFFFSRTINNGSTATITIGGFTDRQNGNGSHENMAGTDFTVMFSDGSIITFSV
ncbi:MAG: prepilin-type N-terminal cleavage/methylation domain-containing protein [candidate division Zixibacteria bacterium]|nr:prepilin-type N-terminal cleavage/methylation domain-containing protein [candidate division Zixibacteria bacterium]